MTPDAHRALNHLAGMGSLATATIAKGDLRDVMIETGGTLFSRGHLYDLKAKHIGGGVVRLSLKAWKP